MLFRSIIRTHKLLDTVRQNTKKVLTCNGDDHKDYDNITKYVSGYCLFNARLSHGISIPPADQAIIDSIDRVVNKVEPLNEPVCLFHGFEKYMHYTIQDNKVNVPGILSKTISLNVAKRFATSEDYFQPKYLVVYYERGSKQIHHDIRMFDQEFKFLTHSNETLKITKVCKYFEGFLQLHTFYVCCT